MRTPWLKIGCILLIITVIAITLADGKKSKKDTASSKDDKFKDKEKQANPKNKPVLNKKKTEKKSKEGEQEVPIFIEDRQEIIVAQERIEAPEVSNTIVNAHSDKLHGPGCPHRAAKLDQVGEIEKNVTALWSQVNALSQPVHIHVHGGRVSRPGRHSQHWDKDGQQGQGWAEKGRSAGPYIPSKHIHGDKVKTHSHGNHSHTDGHHDHSRHHHHHDHSRHHHHHHRRDHSKNHSHGNGSHSHSHGNGSHSHSHNHTHSHHDHSHKIHNYTHQHHDRSHRGRHHDFRGHGHREHSFPKERDYDRRDNGHSTHVHIHLTIDDKPEHQPTSEHPHTSEHPPTEYVNNVSTYARCDLRNSDSNTHLVGYALLRQKGAQDLEVKINISGFLIPPPDPEIEQSETSGVRHLHGFHVHEFGDFSNGCLSFGGHYNPEGHVHGGLAHDVRHVGDWGNIEANEDGGVITYISVSDASLMGPHSILGRGIVVHAGADDLGEADTEVSRASGSAGARLACCIIGSSKPVPDDEW